MTQTPTPSAPENKTTTDASSAATPPQNSGVFTNLIFNIIIPTVILSKFSTPESLGPTWGLIVALAFPVGFGLWDLQRSGKFNFFSILGVVSVLLTGGISLMQLDPSYIAIKEAAIPGLLGIAVIVSQNTRYPLVKLIILNEQVWRMDVLKATLEEHGKTEEFERKVNFSAYLVAASFFLSSVLNYLLAKWILVSPPGTTEFNEELGYMTALSYPVIVVPSMILLFGAIFYLFRQLKLLTGKSIEAFIRTQ